MKIVFEFENEAVKERIRYEGTDVVIPDDCTVRVENNFNGIKIIIGE